MYTPTFDPNGQWTGLQLNGNIAFPVSSDNRFYRQFLAWLQAEGKTRDQWLAEHPYVPPPPDPDTVETLRQMQWVRDNWSALTAREKLIIKLMARRSFPELKDLQ